MKPTQRAKAFVPQAFWKNEEARSFQYQGHDTIVLFVERAKGIEPYETRKPTKRIIPDLLENMRFFTTFISNFSYQKTSDKREKTT